MAVLSFKCYFNIKSIKFRKNSYCSQIELLIKMFFFLLLVYSVFFYIFVLKSVTADRTAT